jgi:hypothetical protein
MYHRITQSFRETHLPIWIRFVMKQPIKQIFSVLQQKRLDVLGASTKVILNDFCVTIIIIIHKVPSVK